MGKRSQSLTTGISRGFKFVEQKFKQVFGPLSTRERIVYSSLTVAFMVILIAPRATADVADVGSVFSVSANQCTSDDNWQNVQNATDQPSTTNPGNRALIDAENAATWLNSAGSISCQGYSPFDENHTITKSAVSVSLKATTELLDPVSEEEVTEVISNVASLDGVLRATRIEQRPALIEPNLFGKDTTATSIDTLLVLQVSDDSGDSWVPLHSFETSLNNNPSTTYEISLPPQFASNPEDLAFKLEAVQDNNQLSVLLDSIVWTYEVGSTVDISSKFIDPEDGHTITEETPVLNQDEDIVVEIGIKDPNDGLLQGIASKLDNVVGNNDEPEISVSASLIDSSGQAINTVEAEPDFTGTDSSNTYTWETPISIMPAAANPGKYTLDIELTTEDGSVKTISQDFLWGVLAINTHKDTYRVSETAQIGMAVLDERGATVCGADVQLRIEGPVSGTTISTDDGISISDNCQVYGTHIDPDYYAEHTFTTPGDYLLTLRAVTPNGAYTIEENIKVTAQQPALEIERTGPTRIFPVVDYPMQITVTAPDGFNGTFTELAPLEYKISQSDFTQPYDSVTSAGNLQEVVWGLNLAAGESINLGYSFDAPNISPEFYLLGPSTASTSDGELFYEEQRQWQIAGDALDVFRVTTYELQTGQFTGTTYDLTLNNTLEANYFAMINGMSSATTTRAGDEDFARVSQDPHGNFGTSSLGNQIQLTRGAATNSWIGSVTVVECLLECDTLGFELKEVTQTSLATGTANNLQTTNQSLAANHTSRTVPIGGHRGGGLSTSDTDNNSYSVTGGVKIAKTGTNQIAISRFGAESRVPAAATVITYVTEWSSSWNVQRANVTGTAAGAGVNATGEYNTAAISSVTRNNTFVWGSGFARDDGLGDGAFGQVVTLGNGVAQNATETTVAVGAHSAQISPGRDFEVTVLENSLLATDYIFKPDGDTGASSGFQELTLTVDAEIGSETYDNASTSVQYTQGQRMPVGYTSGAGVGQNYGRTNWGKRHTASTTLSYWRAYSGVSVNGWFQSVDFANFTVAAPEIQQVDYRWRDDSTDLNTAGGYLAAENTKPPQQDKGSLVRLRFQVANPEPDPIVAAKSFEVQFADKTSFNDCSQVTTWTGITDSATDDFAMVDSDQIATDGEAITSGQLSNTEAHTFINGEGRDSADNTGTIGPLVATSYTELEFAFSPTEYSVTGKNYCFRLYNITDDSLLDEYVNFPELQVTGVPINLPSGLGEAGTFSSVANGGWTTVTFNQTYTTPVVVGTTNTQNGQNSPEFEARNVTSTSAEMRICESEGAASNGCDTHAAETVGYLVIDASIAASTTGIEAGTVSLSAGESGAANVTYSGTFSSTPYVFANTNTVNSTEFPISVVVRNTTATQFNVNICDHLQGSNDNCDETHGSETVGWVAINPNNFDLQEEFRIGNSNIGNSTWTAITFSPAFSANPALVVSSQTDVGAQDVEIDEARSISTTGADIRSCEIDTLDNCDSHSADDIAWFAVETGSFSEDIFLDQHGFRFYENNDTDTPTAPLGDEDTTVTGISDGEVIRLRLATQNGATTIPANQLSIKLQYSAASDCAAAASWTDVGTTGSGTIWRGFDNATPTDGSTLPSSLLDSASNTVQSYEESNSSSLNPNSVSAEGSTEWDFVIQNNGATDNTDYCFRVVSDADDLIQYTTFPQLKTESGVKMLIMYDVAPSGSIIDDFDASLDGSQWNSTIGGAETTDCGSISGNAFQLEAESGERELESVDIDTTGGGNINFALYAPSAADETTDCEQPEAADDLQLQYATDGTGTAWTTIATYDGSAYESWTELSVAIPAGAETSTTRFRWVQPNYSAGNFDHWALDNVSIVSISTPSGWNCVSCIPSDPYYQNFIRGEASYGGTGGSDTHTHTASGSAAATSTTATDTFTGAVVNDVGHAHTVGGLTLSNASNLPAYEGLIILESVSSAESVDTIPQDGVIIFTDATLPAGFTAYTDINGEFARGDAVADTTGGSNTHTHDASGTLNAATGTSQGVDNTPVIVQQDDFDATIDGTQWNDTTGMSAATFCGSSSGNALHSSGGTDDIAETIDVDVSNGGTIDFDLFIADANVGACNGAEAGEDVELEYSTNGGANWTSITIYDEASYPIMTAVSEAIPAGAETSSTRFRWTQLANNGNNFDHWGIDDLIISANPAGTVPAADVGHTHDFDITSSTGDNQPPYVEVVLGQATADTALPPGMIAMFNGANPVNWLCVSCVSGDDFYQSFFKGATSYGGTGGAATHTHANFTSASDPTTTASNGATGTITASDTHTHDVTVSSVSNTSQLPPYVNTVFASLNAPPDSAANLGQETVGAVTIPLDTWISEATVVFTADGTDLNNPDDLQLCVEAQPIGIDFTDVENACGDPVTYSGTAVALSVAIPGFADGELYHWQARLKDDAGDYSAWVSFGANLETETDFKTDTSVPTGTVYDGLTTGVDIDINSGSGSEMEANWDINSDASGLSGYEVSAGTTPGATDISGWDSVGTSTSTTITGASLTTAQVYYFNVRTTDIAGNTSVLSSDGIYVAPSLTFSVSPTTLDLGVLGSGNAYSNTEDTTLTTSTNAYNGYAIRAFATGLLENASLNTIPFFSGGSYAAPDEWMPGELGYGYTSNDSLVNGVNRFNPGTCIGGGSPPCYAAFGLTQPGDIVADTNFPIGTNIVDEEFVISHRVTVDGTQNIGVYSTTVVYNVTARY